MSGTMRMPARRTSERRWTRTRARAPVDKDPRWAIDGGDEEAGDGLFDLAARGERAGPRQSLRDTQPDLDGRPIPYARMPWSTATLPITL